MLVTTAERLIRTCRRPALVVKRVPERAYERLIVPVDFSAYSAPTLTMACRVAPHARISIVHACRVPFESRLAIAGATDDAIRRYCDEERQNAVRRIDQLIAECLPHGLPRRTRRSFSCHPCRSTSASGRSHRHRQTGPAAGQGTPPWQHHSPSPGRINLRYPHGVTTDFSPSSGVALRRAAELARALQAEVVLLHVAEPSLRAPSSTPAAQATEPRMEGKFRQALSASGADDVVREQLLLHGDPADSIPAHATRTKARLIVMGTQGRRGVERLLLGSVAEAVIRAAHCPVLVVRSGGRHRHLAPPAPTAYRH